MPVTSQKMVGITATGTIGEYAKEAVDATGGAIIRTLPPASEGQYKEFLIKKVDSSVNTVTIAAAGSDTIDGLASIELSSQYEKVKIAGDGEVWHIVG